MILEYCDKVKFVFRFCKVLVRDFKYICLILNGQNFKLKIDYLFVKVNILNVCIFCKYIIYEKSVFMYLYR